MKDIFIFILLIVTAATLYKSCNSKCTEEIIETVKITDTVFIESQKVIIKEPEQSGSLPMLIDSIYIPLVDTIYKYDSVYISIPINKYADSINVETGKVHYKHIVQGRLLDSRYKFEIPTTKEIIYKDRVIRQQKRLNIFAVASFKYFPEQSNASRFAAGFDLVGRKYKAGYRIDQSNFGGVNVLNHRIEFGISLFSL